MFIGHFGIGFGAKASAPRVSLGTLFLGAQWLDLLWPTLLLLGLETVAIDPGATRMTPLRFVHYPISHSLLMVVLWGVVVGAGYGVLRKSWNGALVLGLCVVSHWILDLIVHRPDLPLYPGPSPLVGLGLWNSMGGTFFVEGLLFALGVVLYLRTTTARNRVGAVAFWGLVGVLVLIHLANVFGPPPANTTAIAWVGQLQWLLVLWGYWVDRNRTTRAPAGEQPAPSHG